MAGYLGIQEKVVRLDVSVDEVESVDGVYGQYRLRYVEPGMAIWGNGNTAIWGMGVWGMSSHRVTSSERMSFFISRVIMSPSVDDIINSN